MTVKISALGLKPGVQKKLSPPMTTTDDLYVMRPENLRVAFALTEKHWANINDRLRAHGQRTLGDWPAPAPRAPRESSLHRRCKVALETDDGETTPCGRPSEPRKQKCLWHDLLAQPIAEQLAAADARRAANMADGEHVVRLRVPEAEWPAGERWCSECQGFVPLFYCRGSRCYAHASRAAHASMIKRVYNFTREDYDTLLAWQKGRCYVCRQVPRAKRLAVDHDHRTGEIRGLLCASDEFGCNHTLRVVLNNLEMARRLLDYVESPPAARCAAGEPSPFEPTRSAFAGFLS